MAEDAVHQVLRHRDREPGPWANGGGITYEVTRSPEASPDAHAFDWRLSVAEVAAEGPFSSFPGVDRVLILLRGSMQLVIDGTPYDVPPFAPLSFPGEAQVDSLLTDGPTTDFNVMTRRDRVSAAVDVVTGTSLAVSHAPDAELFVFVLDGAWAIDGLDDEIATWDCVVAGGALAMRGEGALAVVTIRMRNR